LYNEKRSHHFGGLNQKPSKALNVTVVYSRQDTGSRVSVNKNVVELPVNVRHVSAV